MNIYLAQNKEHAELWEQFVDRRPDSGSYHRWRWKRVVEQSFGWPTFYLMAEEGGTVQGILPLVWQRSWIFGSFLTSLPFFNSGGVLAETPQAREALLAEAISLVSRCKAKYLELRHREDLGLRLPAKTNKVSVVLPVSSDQDKVMKSLRNEVRSKIRKTERIGLKSEMCGAEVLDDFYSVFAINMRDLGTPVYSKLFFEEILLAFPEDTFICVVRHNGKAIASSLTIAFRDTLETVWGSSLREYNSMSPNMLMYWQMIAFACQKGFKTFDFGRSTVGSGPHKFKLQWSNQEVPMHWNYWVPGGRDVPELNPQNPRYQFAIHAWQRLPISLTKIVGPRIVRCLP